MNKMIALALFATTVVVAAEPTANVFIYRPRVYSGGGRRMTLSIDGKRFAYLQNGRYFALNLPAGEHVLSDKRPRDYINFTVKPGEACYIRAEWGQGFYSGFDAHFSVADPATAGTDIRRLKPGDRDQVQDPSSLADGK